jgi:flagellar motor protein MotB
MQKKPFSDHFGSLPGSSWATGFGSMKGAGLARKPEAAPEPEPEPELLPVENAEKPPVEKVVLKNPLWEIEKVGFNEETDISVEVELPEAHAHKTRVEFELFAQTPNGPEPISKGEGSVEGGKAVARVPVYMPKFKDEFGNLLEKVVYFFTAKHSDSDLLKDADKTKDVEELADPFLESHVVPDVAFATGKSFPAKPEALKALSARLGEWKSKHKDGKLAVFGHADAVGKEDANKSLSERRATAVHAFLVKDAAVWETRYNEDKWGLASTQELLRNLGHDAGALDGKDGPKTQAAVKDFQSKHGLGATGQADAATRKALYSAFMDACNTQKLGPKDFDAIDGKPHVGCSEFNRFEDTQGDCAANRRVTVALLKATKNFPIHYPCKHGDIGPCKKQAGRKGERRTKGFGCFFYDKVIKEAAGEGPKPVKDGKAWFQPHADHPFGYDKHGKFEAEDQNGAVMDCKGEPELDYLSVESGKTGLVELRYDVVEGKEIFFHVEDGGSATINVKDASASPLVLEVVASKAEKNFLETKILARQNSPDGPLLGELGLVILAPKSYAATYFRIEDPANPDTKLTTALTVAELNGEMNKLYRPGVAEWKIGGEDKVTEIGYDLIKNGSLDLEPGVKSKELKKIIKGLPDEGVNIIHVHELRWSYFLAKSAKADDTVLTLKDYGGSLDFIGTITYNVEDGAGNSVAIEVASVDKAKCEITLSGPIGVEFKLADSPALIWPLGGLSGNPTLISDIGSQEDLIIYAAHELGHTLADFFDLVEKENIMYGGASTGKGLRHRPIPRYYSTDENEEQWKHMRKK